MLATHTPRAHAVPHPERGVHAVRFVALQRSSSETPAPTNPALPGTAGVPHPFGPSSSPSVHSDLCVAARSPSHFLGVTGGSSGTLPPKVQQTLQFQRSSVRPRLCAHLALVYRRCRQCASAAVPLCTVSRRAPIRGNPIACAALARRRVARRPKISPVHFRPRRTAQRRRSPRPTAPGSNPRVLPRG